ncbi:IclR family acetate operon transcriptional repressor [Rubricella aquisinus]|uniref:IclR family acetate operon transcriptional repressor n=1 Tax=Rubricella aquisinus TaxID=2028108 RepID=A0A840X3N3_9RHOB|nr:IclR family transcriptional regulator C-terminal domain-containing protein [Rubricella aquisinus]MBB5516445.1 IclR family acetate operon transcriptional repressor [Rubricella aquisinus]
MKIQPRTEAEQDRTGQVRSVVRSLTVLRAIAATDNGLTLTEVAERAGLPASTTHRLLTTLESERFVRFDAGSGVWQIGVNAFVVGSAFTRTRNLLALAKPYLRRLMDLTGETANIFVENGGQVVCLDQVESRFTMRAITQVGGRLPMHCSGSGKALLSQMPPERQARIMSDIPLEQITPHTVVDQGKLIAQLTKARTDGVAIDDQEHAEGLRCVASCVFGELGQPIAAISVSGPTSRITDARIVEIAANVQKIAAEITAEFGGTTEPALRSIG